MPFSRLKGSKVLIVDDEQDLRETLRTHLELEDAVVTEASNGLEAYALILKNSYDVILSDIRMPGCSGVELLEKIRNSKIKTAPVVLMSAFTDITEDKAKELGARGMFLKPENIIMLKELIIDTLEGF